MLFTESLSYFFFYFFHMFNLDFFAWFRVCSGSLVIATPPTVLYNPSEISQVSLSRSEDMHVLFTES